MGVVARQANPGMALSFPQIIAEPFDKDYCDERS
jgi:hypothetical protein